MRRHPKSALSVLLGLALCKLWAAPVVTQIGPDLFAYISDNDGSANATFVVGREGILVVDTGMDAKEGTKLLNAIRAISALPVTFIVNTHYHPDHQGGNAVVGPNAKVITTDYTRQRTLSLLHSGDSATVGELRPAAITFSHMLTIHLDPYVVEVTFPGKAHTSGDAFVYFSQQQAVSTGDLFLNRSSPAMDEGSVENWIKALDGILDKQWRAAVPGHFEVGSRVDVERFRDYLRDLFRQVKAMRARGLSLAQIKANLHTEKYKDFRQYPQYEATFTDNAETIYKQLDRP